MARRPLESLIMMCSAFMVDSDAILFFQEAAFSVLPARAAGGSRISGISRLRYHLGVFVKDNQGTDYSRNPSRAGEQQHNQYRSTTLVQNSQRRENNR